MIGTEKIVVLVEIVITINNLHGLVDFLLAWLRVVTALPDVYGHTMLKTPVLVRSLKLSNIGLR